MRLFLGFLIGVVLACVIALTAMKSAWGGIGDIGDRDRKDDETRIVDVTDFDRVDAAGVFELKIAVGGDYSVSLAGRAEDLARTTATVAEGALVLDTNERDASGKRKFVKHGITATIRLPSLVAISASGVVDGEVTGVAAEKFDADISGVGELNLAGTCGALTADVSGVGELNAENLKCRSVDVDLSGVGEAKVYASESADADLAGIGEIEIYGSPGQVSKSKSSPFGRIEVK